VEMSVIVTVTICWN